MRFLFSFFLLYPLFIYLFIFTFHFDFVELKIVCIVKSIGA